MGRFLRVLGISQGEWPRLLAMAGLFFWVMLGWSMGRSGRDAFFLKEVGAGQLPYMYVLNAVLMVAVSVVYAGVVDRVARYRLMVGQLAACGVLLLGLWAVIPMGMRWTPYAVFSLSEVFVLLFLMHYWTYANDVFNPREGKRIFPLIGGAGLLGGFVGGFLTRPLVALVGTVNLFIVWAVLFLLAVPLVLWCQRQATIAGVAANKPVTDDEEGLGQILNYVWQVPLLRTLTYLSVPMWLVVYIVDYQFFIVMDELFPQQDQLTGFLGLFNSVTSLIGLGLQLFVTGWVLRRFGVGRAVWVHPIGLSLGAVALAARSFFPALAAPRFMSFNALSGAFAKFSDNAIFYSIGESASQLLFNALPKDKRGRGRAFIAGAVEPACTALAGVLLLLFEAFDAPLPVISGTALVLCAGWLGWTRRLKGEYLRALASNLSDPDPGQSGDALAALSRLGAAEAMPVLLEHLQADDEEMTWLALELLEHIEDPAVPARLAAYLDRVDAPRQRALLGTLERRRDASTLAQIQPLLASDQPSVRAAAARAMRSLGAPASHLDGLLKDPDVGVRAEAVAALLAVADLRATAELMRLTTSGDDRSRERAAYVLGQAGGTGRLDLLTRLCADSVAAVRRSCAAALVQVGGQQAAALLVEMVDDPQAGSAALDGLVEMGPVALDAMAQRWDEVDSAVRTNLALCLSKMSGDAVHAFLIQRLAGEQESVQEACIEALAVLGNLPSDAVPPLEQALRTSVARLQRLSAWAVDLADLAPAMLLHDALLRRAAQAEKVALRCVELLGPARQVQVAVANLKSPVARLRAEALEVLEGACSAARVLVQELERRYLHPQSSGQGEPRRALEALARIELTSWERACLYYALQQAGYQDLATDLDFKEVQNMAGNIERILFLKSASLFADVAGSDLPWIDEIAREHTYPAGEVIFRENEMGDTLYIIVEGQVRVLKGEEAVTLAVLQERDCFGEMAILDGEPRSATVETMREARLLEIAREDFNQLLLARPQIGFALIKNLNRRLRQTNAKLIEKEA